MSYNGPPPTELLFAFESNYTPPAGNAVQFAVLASTLVLSRVYVPTSSAFGTPHCNVKQTVITDSIEQSAFGLAGLTKNPLVRPTGRISSRFGVPEYVGPLIPYQVTLLGGTFGPKTEAKLAAQDVRVVGIAPPDPQVSNLFIGPPTQYARLDFSIVPDGEQETNLVWGETQRVTSVKIKNTQIWGFSSGGEVKTPLPLWGIGFRSTKWGNTIVQDKSDYLGLRFAFEVVPPILGMDFEFGVGTKRIFAKGNVGPFQENQTSFGTPSARNKAQDLRPKPFVNHPVLPQVSYPLAHRPKMLGEGIANFFFNQRGATLTGQSLNFPFAPSGIISTNGLLQTSFGIPSLNNSRFQAVLAPVTSSISVRVPTAIEATLSSVLAAFSASNIYGTTTTGTLERTLADFFSGITANVRPPVAGDIAAVLSVYGTISVKVEPPREATISPTLATVIWESVVISATPTEVNLTLRTADVVMLSFGEMDQGGRMWARISHEYGRVWEYDFNFESDYFATASYIPKLLHFYQPDPGLIPNISLGFGYPNTVDLVLEDATSQIRALAWIAGTLANPNVRSFFDTDVDLDTSYQWVTNTLSFLDTLDCAVSFSGTTGTTIPQLLSVLDNVSLDTVGSVEYVGTFVGRRKPEGYNLDLVVDKNSNENLFGFGNPSIEDVSAEFLAFNGVGKYGPMVSQLSNVTFTYGIHFTGIVKTHIGTATRNLGSFDLDEQHAYYGNNFHFQLDGLGLAASIVGKRGVLIDADLSVITESVSTAINGTIGIGGTLNNDWYNAPESFDLDLHPEAIAEFRRTYFHFNQSALNFGVSFRLVQIEPVEVLFDVTLQNVVPSFPGLGHIKGYIGGEYLFPANYNIDFNFEYKLPDVLNFYFTHTKHLDAISTNVQGAHNTGTLHKDLSNLNIAWQGIVPRVIVGNLSKTLDPLGRTLLVKVALGGVLSGTLSNCNTFIQLQTLVAVQATLVGDLGNALFGSFKGVLPYRATLSANMAGLSSYFQLRTPASINVTIGINTGNSTTQLRWFNQDNSKTMTLYRILSPITTNFRLVLELRATFDPQLANARTDIQARVEIYGTMASTLASVVSGLRATVPTAVTAQMARTFDSVIFQGTVRVAVAGSIQGFLDNKPRDKENVLDVYFELGHMVRGSWKENLTLASVVSDIRLRTTEFINMVLNKGLEPVSSNIRLAQTTRGQMTALPGNMTGYFIATHNLGRISSILTMSSDIRVRIPVAGNFHASLDIVEVAVTAFQPRPLFGQIVSELGSFFAYFRGATVQQGSIELYLGNVRGKFDTLTYYGDMHFDLSPSLYATIYMKKGPPVAVTIDGNTGDCTARFMALSVTTIPLILVMDPIRPDINIRVPIHYDGWIRGYPAGVTGLFRLHASQNRYATMDVQLRPMSFTAGIIVAIAGDARMYLDNVIETPGQFRGLVPIHIQARIHPRLAPCYGTMQALVPSLMRLDIFTLSPATDIRLFISTGKLRASLEVLECRIRMVTVSTTKVTVRITTANTTFRAFGRIETAGTMSGHTGDTVRGTFVGVFPPQPKNIFGLAHNTLSNATFRASGSQLAYKVTIDLRMDSLKHFEIKLLAFIGGHLSSLMWGSEVDIWLEHFAFPGRLLSSLQSVRGTMRGYSVVRGTMHRTLSDMTSSVRLETFIARQGRIMIGTEDWFPSENDRRFGLLTGYFFGQVPSGRITGRMDVVLQTIPYFFVSWTGQVPYRQTVKIEPVTSTVYVSIQGHCPLGGKLNSRTDDIYPLLLIQDVYGKIDGQPDGDMMVSSGIKLQNAFRIDVLLVPVTDSIKTNFRGRVQVYGRIMGVLSGFREVRIVSQQQSTGYLVGGDTEPNQHNPYLYGVGQDARWVGEILIALGMSPESFFQTDRAKNPAAGKYYTLGYVTANIVGRIPEDPSRTGRLRTTVSDSGAAFQPGFGNSCYIQMRAITPPVFYGHLAINSNGEDFALVCRTTDISFFMGRTFLKIQGTWRSELKKIVKLEIKLHHSTGEGAMHRLLSPATMSMIALHPIVGFLNLITGAATFRAEAKGAMHHDMLLHATLENLRPLILADFPAYRYGGMYGNFVMRGTFSGRVAVHGFITSSDLTVDKMKIEAFVEDMVGVLLIRTNSFRMSFYLNRGMAYTFSGGMALRMAPATASFTVGVNIFTKLLPVMAPITSNITARTSFRINGYGFDNILGNTTGSMFGIGHLFGDAYAELDPITAEGTLEYIYPRYANINVTLPDTTGLITGHIPALATISATLGDVRLTTLTLSGDFGDMSASLDSAFSNFMIKLYQKSDILPSTISEEVSGDVNYGYTRNVGSKVRLYEDGSEELLGAKTLQNSENSYTFADVSEGSYYVIGTPNQSRVKSAVFDEVEIEP